LRGFPHRHGCGQKEPREKRHNTKVDIPDHTRADQGELLAQGEIRARQEPLTNALAA
jgi:hypothetical protein